MSLDLSQLSALHVKDDPWICQTVRAFLRAFGVMDIRAVRDRYIGYDALRAFIRGPHFFGLGRRRTHGIYGGADRRKAA